MSAASVNRVASVNHVAKATVHLVSVGKDESDYYTLSKMSKRLEKKHPGITKAMKRGDIIENIDESGYRSQGVYMWDGKRVIHQNHDWDDYGSPSQEFLLLTEFPPGYWDKPYSGKHNPRSG